MKRLQDLPLATKLTALNLVISGVSLCLALAACFAFLFQLTRHHERADIGALAQIIAANATPTFEFHDDGGARMLLSTLQARREILHARLLYPSGAEFASYSAPGAPADEAAAARRWWILDVAQPIGHPGEPPLGRLEMEANVSGAMLRLLPLALTVFVGILICALGLAYLVAIPLQRAVTRPILDLSDAAKRVAETNDYSVRVPKRSGDEIGRLTGAFNSMLADLEGRRDLEKRLEQAQRLESLGVLAGGIAHDFNNLLTGILCSASLARMDLTPDAPIAEHLQRIETSSQRAAELCEQMLAYAGRNRSDRRTVVQLNSLIRETLELLHASVPKDAELKVELDPGLPSSKGDPSRVRQILMNLVINASEALCDPPRRIVIATRRRVLSAADLSAMRHADNAQPGEFAVVEVADTGVGMSAEQLTRIFEPFYTSKFTGRGLGLASVLGIMGSVGGALHVTSVVGRGTTFSAAFPAVAAETEAAAPEPAPPKPAPAHVEDRGTVLVVDDEEPVRSVAAAALRRLGYTVLTSEDGPAAVQLVRTYPGSIRGVLLDVTMPGMDGAATLQELRRHRPELKAVLMSGYDEKASLRRFDDLRVGGFLQKPFSAETLSHSAAAWE